MNIEHRTSNIERRTSPSPLEGWSGGTRLLLVALGVLFLTAAVSAAGTFTDRDGAAHSWMIDPAHALVWEGAPYVPFGVVFEPAYLTVDQTDANWTADEKEVADLKAAGITDVILKFGKGISLVPVEALQRVIDLLETNDLRYGVELYDPPYTSLKGYVVQPAIYRREIRMSGEVTQGFADAASAIYAVCDMKSGELGDIGEAQAINGSVTVLAHIRNNTDNVVLFYPRRTIAAGSADSCLPDIWSDYDSHRDRLLNCLSQVKFGKGLRFFIDPFTESLGISGDVEGMIPTSAEYRLQYTAWLSKKYGSPRDLNVVWGIMQHELSSYEETVRLIPLWRNGRGAAAVYDPATKERYLVDATRSNMWTDFLEFQAVSMRQCMDGMADVLKRKCADVPFVYTANGLIAAFQPADPVGYDGLAVPGSADSSPMMDAGRVFSMAEHSSRRVWMLSRLKSSTPAYENKEDMFAAINARHDLGAKGFFVEGLASADVMKWLTEYASISAEDRQFTSYMPMAMYYPKAATKAAVKRLSSGIWWLPALVGGSDLYLGSGFAGYSIVDPSDGRVDVCIWSLSGNRVVHVLVQNEITLVDATGNETKVKPKKGKAQFVVGTEPIFIRGISADTFLPVEVVEDAMQEFEEAIARAEAKKLDVLIYKHNLDSAKDLLKQDQLVLCLQAVQSNIDEINLRLKSLETTPSTETSTGSTTGIL